MPEIIIFLCAIHKEKHAQVCRGEIVNVKCCGQGFDVVCPATLTLLCLLSHGLTLTSPQGPVWLAKVPAGAVSNQCLSLTFETQACCLHELQSQLAVERQLQHALHHLLLMNDLNQTLYWYD